MRRPIVSLALVLLASAVFAQTEPRDPVILSERGGEDVRPGPDPTGVYSGTVTFTLGDASELTQTWRIPLKAQPCPSCPVGQYVVSETDYSMARYPRGIERGSVWGVVNPDGAMFLELRGINCDYLTLGLGGDSIYQSGALGPSPGAPMRLANGTITGRISGYDCFGQRVVADVLLREDTSTAPKSCPYLSTVYAGEFDDSCGGVVHADAIPTQAGCAVTVYSPAARAAFNVVLATPTTGTVAVNFTDGCSGTASGTAEISGGILSGEYSGTSEGGPGCCPPGPVSGTFTLSPK